MAAHIEEDTWRRGHVRCLRWCVELFVNIIAIFD